MKLAILEAKKGIDAGHGGPFGAVIVKDNKVIGKGHNCVIKNNDPTCHGEIMAIHDACKNVKDFNLKGSIIYTTGYPCPMCFGAILWAKIDKIYYGCNLEDTNKIGFKDLEFYNDYDSEDFKKEKIIELDHEECLELYADYLTKTNKKSY